VKPSGGIDDDRVVPFSEGLLPSLQADIQRGLGSLRTIEIDA
jgi:hypothetical protein